MENQHDQKEVTDLEHAHILKKRTRGGSSEAGSPAKKKTHHEPHHKSKRTTRKLELSDEVGEELEEESSLAQLVEEQYVEATK